ncbi:hypothetical protein ACSZNL_14735 [Aeromonas jandaei]
MKKYLNLSGNSSILSYELTDTSIHVQFKSGTHRNYLYDNAKPGEVIVNKMKALASQGHGLNSYITRVVKTNYSKRW